MLAWLAEHVEAPGAIVRPRLLPRRLDRLARLGRGRGPSPRAIPELRPLRRSTRSTSSATSTSTATASIRAPTRALFDRFTRAFAAAITARPGRHPRAGLGRRPIALLFVDLSKTLEINDHILKAFFGALVPGSLVVQQDFLFFRNPWLYPTMHRLEAAMPSARPRRGQRGASSGCGARPLPQEIARCLSRNLTPEATLAAIAHFRARFPRSGRPR